MDVILNEGKEKTEEKASEIIEKVKEELSDLKESVKEEVKEIKEEVKEILELEREEKEENKNDGKDDQGWELKSEMTELRKMMGEILDLLKVTAQDQDLEQEATIPIIPKQEPEQGPEERKEKVNLLLKIWNG